MNDGRSSSSSLFLAELSVKGPTKAKVQKQRKKSNWKLSHSSILLYPPPLILFQLGFFQVICTLKELNVWNDFSKQYQYAKRKNRKTIEGNGTETLKFSLHHAQNQCPWLAQCHFSKSASSSSLGLPSFCLIWTSFAHSIILQNLPNKATFTAKLDR